MHFLAAAASLVRQITSRDHYQQLWNQLIRMYACTGLRRLPPEILMADQAAMHVAMMASTPPPPSSSFGCSVTSSGLAVSSSSVLRDSSEFVVGNGTGLGPPLGPSASLCMPNGRPPLMQSLGGATAASIDSLRQRALEYAATIGAFME
jgi:hypothetical protein